MRKGIVLSIVSLIALATFAGEGIVVTQKYTGNDVLGGASVTVTWYVSNTQCKMKMDYKADKVSSNTWFLPELNTSKILMYAEGDVPSNAQKAYFAVPVQEIKSNADVSVSRVTIEKTGELRTIGGFQCEKMIVKTNKNITEMWVTRDFKPNYFKYYPFFQNSLALMGLSEESIQGFPLESITKDNLGNVLSGNQFVSATSISLSESDFKVPAEYKNAEDLASPAKK